MREVVFVDGDVPTTWQLCQLQVKLSQVPVSIAELPSGAGLSSPGSPVPAPRVLVRKRPDRLGPRGAGLPGQQADYLQAGVAAGLPYADGSAAAGFRCALAEQLLRLGWWACMQLPALLPRAGGGLHFCYVMLYLATAQSCGE